MLALINPMNCRLDQAFGGVSAAGGNSRVPDGTSKESASVRQ
jgi:hypothetical protein